MKTCPYCAESVQNEAVVCKHCRRDLPHATPTKPSTTKKRGDRLLLLLAVLVVALIAYKGAAGSERIAGGDGGTMQAMPPRMITIADAETFQVAAEGFYRWEFTVNERQPSCHITGHIEVTEGGNKDVQVFVMTADDYKNFANGHEARAFFQTPKTSAATLDVNVTHAGPMVLAISNAFSLVTAKTVRLDSVRAVCQ